MGARELFNKNFTLIFLGQLVSQLGSALYVIVIVFWLKEATHSPSMVSLLLMLSVIPGIVLGPLCGVVADRYSRKKLIVLSDFLTGLLIIGTGLLMYSIPDRKDLIITILPLVIILKGTFWIIFQTTLSASVPDIVPTSAITPANALLETTIRVSELIGQFLGGVLFVTLGAPVMMLTNGLCFLLSAFSALFLTLSAPATHERARVWREQIRAFKIDIHEGFKFVRGQPGLTSLILVAATSKFYYGPLIVLLPFFVEESLDLTPEWYGFLMAALTVGSLIGGGLAGLLKSASTRGRVVASALFVSFATLIYLSYSSSGLMAVLALLVNGLCSGVLGVLLNSAIQRSSPTHVRGRVFGLYATISLTLIAASIGFSGVVADILDQDIALIYTCCGLFGLAAPIYLLFSRALHLIGASEDRGMAEVVAPSSGR